ncbi:hypothetical protein PPUJ20066_36340 [Pseudomonas putida]|nr:hypothetical protein PPUJ20066_36340 [Pseudomonas putida]
MVEMHVRDDQRLNTAHLEARTKTLGRGLRAQRCIITLRQAAIDQQAGSGVKVKLVARASYASGGAVMRKNGEIHAAAHSPGPKMKCAITS